MALTYTAEPPQLIGTQRRVRGTVTFDSSYLTGGEVFDPKAVGLTSLISLDVEVGNSTGTNGYALRWNRSASAPTIVALQGDNDNAADAPLIEVASTTNLSALVARYEAVGY